MGTIQGKTLIGNAGIKKHFLRTEPARAIVELIWNGFDARAREVSVELLRNELDQLDVVTVIDDGDGIDVHRVKDSFGRFNESNKQEDVTSQGSNGRGRLAFHRLAHRATWYTRSRSGDASIEITSGNLENFSGRTWEPGESHGRVMTQSGTCVVLDMLHNALPEAAEMRQELSTEFGWYLLLNTDKTLTYDGAPVAAPAHSIEEEAILSEGHEFKIRIIRWHERLATEKSYVYLQNSDGKRVHRQLSSHNKKPGFFASVYVQSSWADAFAPKADLLNSANSTPESKAWREVECVVVERLRKMYEVFLREHVEREIRRYEEDGSFPSLKDVSPADAKWRSQNIRQMVRSLYLADPHLFTSLNKKQRSVLIRLLDRLTVSNESDALMDVLAGVLDLDSSAVLQLADQLNRLSLESIIETIEVLQKRQLAVQQIQELMRVHYKEVRETPDLQKIVERNTWLFGPQFETLGAEETTFTEIARRLRAKIRDIDTVTEDDVEDDATVEVSLRQPDLFLVRRFPVPDAVGRMQFRWVIVEIKRPAVALNYRHLRQIEDYVRIIEGDPEFAAQQTRVDLILVGRKVSSKDTDIASRLRQISDRGVPGLIRQDEKFTVYILNWETLLAGFELTNAYLLQHLRLRRAALGGMSKEDLVQSLSADEVTNVG